MKPQTMAQKISITIAIISYLASIACAVATVYWQWQVGGYSPVSASLGASVVFFLGVGIVLHVIGRADLPDLRIPR
jgi:hypothetical protein